MLKPAPDDLKIWNKPVPPEWQADLDRLNPGDAVSKLVLAWQPATQRWEIYEVLPAEVVNRILIQEELRGITDSMLAGMWGPRFGVRGPDPAENGHWVLDTNGKHWRTRSMVSRTQWLLHKRWGGLPYRFWIIEGAQGGHAWNLGSMERSFLASAGVSPKDIDALAEAWPAPGSQPYADYDQRVFRALAERDRLAKWKQSLSWTDRVNRDVAPDLIMAERKQRYEDNMQRVLKFIDNQVGDFVSDLPRRVVSQIPKDTMDGDFNEDGPGMDLLRE